MAWIRTIKADENLNKHYRIEVWYDDDTEIFWNDIQQYLVDNNIEIFSNLSRYSLAKNEQRYNGNPEELKKEGYDLRPIYAYIHGGVALSLGRGGQFSDQFDSGLAGFAAVKGKFTSEQEKALENYIKEYNNLQTTTFYGYSIYDENDEVADSCGGFAGNSEEEIADEMFANIPNEYNITKNNILFALKHPRG